MGFLEIRKDSLGFSIGFMEIRKDSLGFSIGFSVILTIHWDSMRCFEILDRMVDGILKDSRRFLRILRDSR